MKKHEVFCVALACAALFGCGSSKTEETQVDRIRVGIIPIAEVAQLYVGIDRGFFTQRNIELELIPMAGGAKILEVLGPNGVDIGFSNVVSLTLFHAQGMRFVALAGASYETPANINHAILVKAESVIESGADLEGKTVAVNTLRNIEELMLKRYLDGFGLQDEAVILRPVPFPVMNTVLEKGEVDAISTVEPFISLAVSSGKARVLANQYLALEDKALVATYVTYEEWIDSNPDLAARFVQAFDEATQYIHDYPSESRSIIGKFTKIPKDLLPSVGLPLLESNVAPEAISKVVEELMLRGWIEREIAASELLRNPLD